MDSLDIVALQCLGTTDPEDKVRLTRAAHDAWCGGRIDPTHSFETPLSAESVAGRPPKPHLVPPRQLPRRGLGSVDGRAALLHAVAHIEFNAMNLAWDAVYRFAGMPRAYYDDWIGVAADEARHFQLLQARLAGCGYAYGDFDAHNGLWEMACTTADSCLARMALVPRVLEARGLDVTPGMIERLLAVGDKASVEILEIILREEVAHVAAGSRWFAWCCEREACEPQSTFRALLRQHLGTMPKPPFNRAARRAAGFSDEELDQLLETDT